MYVSLREKELFEILMSKEAEVWTLDKMLKFSLLLRVSIIHCIFLQLQRNGLNTNLVRNV